MTNESLQELRASHLRRLGSDLSQHSQYDYRVVKNSFFQNIQMCSIVFWIVMILSLLAFVYVGFWLFNPGCPKYQWKPHLNSELYLGRWYEMYRPKQGASFETGECVVAEYLHDPISRYYFKVINSQQHEDGQRQFVTGKAQQVDNISGRFQVRFNSFQPWVNMDILETDYHEYAIVYSCTNILGMYTQETIWALMRKPWEIGSP